MSSRTRRNITETRNRRRASTIKRAASISQTRIDVTNLNDYPLFSVIILTYQQQDLIFQCIDSVLAQDYPNIELVICDDSSFDYDELKIRKHIAQNRRRLKNLIIYHQPQNVGIVRNAQTGVELSSGAYFKILAADDFFYGDSVLSRMAEHFEDPDTKIIASLSIACGRDGTITNHFYPSGGAFECMDNADATQQFALLGTQARNDFISSPAVFWKRELFDQMGGFDLSYRFTEDWPMWLRITASGQRISMVNDATVVYRYGGIFNDNNVNNLEYREAQYSENIMVLQDIALPHFIALKDKKRMLRCQQSIECNKARLICEFEWPYWSIWRKLGWRLKNVRFLVLSWLYRIWQRGIGIKWKPAVVGMAVFLFLFSFDVKIAADKSASILWSWGFVFCLGWLVVIVVASMGFRALSFLLKRGGR